MIATLQQNYTELDSVVIEYNYNIETLKITESYSNTGVTYIPERGEAVVKRSDF